VPNLPLAPPPQPTQAPKDSASETGTTMAVSVVLMGCMAVALICFLYIARTVAQWYGERKQRKLMYASPEKDVEMPDTVPMKPQRVGRASGEKPMSAMERRRRELGTLSSMEFKVKAAALRAQVAECVDNCSPKVIKKDAKYRQARDSTPVKTGTGKKADRGLSPGHVSFGVPVEGRRKKDLGSAPPVPPAPESLPEGRQRKLRERERERERDSSSPSRRQRSDSSRIERHGEMPPNDLVQHLPPPPAPPGPPPPGRQLPAIPRDERSGGMSQDGQDVMLNF